MTDGGVRAGGPYERALARVVSDARYLLEAGEAVEAAAIVQRGIKPRYALLAMALGAGLFASGLSSPDSPVPDAVSGFVALPLFVAGALLMAIPGQALLLLTAGTAFVVSRPPLPWLRPRLLVDAPARALAVDLERGLATVAGHRLWALAGRTSTLRELAAGSSGGAPGPATSMPVRLHRRGALLAGLLGGAIVATLVLTAFIESDAEEIERVITEYNGDLFRGRGEEACSALTPEAQRELIEEATAKLGRLPKPRTCPTAVEIGAERLNEARRDREPGSPNILEIEVEGARASVRVGAAFAYERLPMTREPSGWKQASVRAAAVVRDAPPDDPPSLVDFAARVEGTCRNVARIAVPVSARLVTSPAPSTSSDARALADLFEELARADQELARDLASLTPPRGGKEDVQLILDALRRFGDAREELAETLTAGASDGSGRSAESATRARESYGTAAREAGLEQALGDCL